MAVRRLRLLLTSAVVLIASLSIPVSVPLSAQASVGPDAGFRLPDIKTCPGLIGQPQTRQDLLSEYICVPSLARPAGTPEQLNKASFIRVHERSPRSSKVDAVIIYGANFGDNIDTELPAEIVEMAAKQGKNVEVWCMLHREVNLQDTRGLGAAAFARDPSIALRYYFGDNYVGSTGRFDGVLGGTGSSFTPLQQSDVPFMADWGADVQNADVESVLDLVPPAERASNAFLMSASPNSEFNTQFAGFKLHDGKRGYQELAGIIAVEGNITSIGSATPPTQDAINAYLNQVKAIQDGTAPSFDTTSPPAGGNPNGTSGVSGRIASQIIAMSAMWQPNRESIFEPLPGGAVGGPLADQFNSRLRLTNQARDAFSNSADPVPGTFLAAPGQSRLGGREGHLAFTPQPGAAQCAAPGPNGMVPPCVPPVSQIDTSKVYGWATGGVDGPGEAGNPLSGWTESSPGVFSSANVNAGPNPSNITLNEAGSMPGTRTNDHPITVRFPTSGKVTIDSSFKTDFSWYLDNRYDNVDVPFINTYQKVDINRPDLGVHLDFDKSGVNIPVIEYVVHLGTTNPWPKVTDFSVVAPDAVTQTAQAAQRSPLNKSMNLRLYNNIDIHTADNSLGTAALRGTVTPGDVGANPIPDTLVSWLMARAGRHGVSVPQFSTHVNCLPLSTEPDR